MTYHEAKILSYFSKHSDVQPIPEWVKQSQALALQSRGFLGVDVGFTNAYTTDAGLAALNDYKDLRFDRYLTRGIAVLALVISILTLALELDDRGYLGKALPGFKAAQSVEQDLPE